MALSTPPTCLGSAGRGGMYSDILLVRGRGGEVISEVIDGDGADILHVHLL